MNNLRTEINFKHIWQERTSLVNNIQLSKIHWKKMKNEQNQLRGNFMTAGKENIQ